ncbi:MAG TPA: DUF1127 domain-containing protein [Burkholderiaceae bacterium]|nr:DUF1127 domain-containing protein [Burkholderiaceae bacterium]
MSQTCLNAEPRDSTSVARIKRNYLPGVDSLSGVASNDSSYRSPSAELPLAAWSRRAELANGFGDAAVEVEPVGPDSVRRAEAAREFRHAHLGELLAEFAAAFVDATHRAGSVWQRWRDQRATERALRSLDARTLRDIGFDPCEVRSVAPGRHCGAEPNPAHGLMRLRYLQI